MNRQWRRRAAPRVDGGRGGGALVGGARVGGARVGGARVAGARVAGARVGGALLAGALVVSALAVTSCGSAIADGPVTVTVTEHTTIGGPAAGSAGAVSASAGSGTAASLSANSSGPASSAPLSPGAPSSGSTSEFPGSLAPSSSGPITSSLPARPLHEFTLALAGDVHFSERTADLLAADPHTALKEAAGELSAADITMVNLETAITTGGNPAPKQFHFRAPATALDALAAGGVDVVTMANNHAVDHGDAGLADTLAAVADSPVPVIGIGKDADEAYAPYVVTVNGVMVAFLAASQVHDWTIATHTATDDSPGIASGFSQRLVTAVQRARAKADVVVVYLHWGIEHDTCPSGEQKSLADALARAGATAVVGTHAHVLQGAGWRDDGVYVAYGLGNYYWWWSFGNEQDDNGVLTLTFRNGRVTAADFLPTHLDSRGVPMVATGKQKARILAEWERDRKCSGLAATATEP